MKRIHSGNGTGPVTVAICVLTLLTACQTTTPNYRQGERTADRINDYRDAVVSIQESIDITAAALEHLVEQAHVDPRRPFRQFVRAVDGVEQANETALRRANDMRAQGREFFEQWQREIASMQNPEARQLAGERKDTLDRAFRHISQVTVEARDELRPWLAYVRDLETLLGNDLTIAGIDAARDLISTAKTEGAQVRMGYDTLIDELNSVAAAIGPVRGQN